MFSSLYVNDVKSHDQFAKKIKLCVDAIILLSSSSDSAITTTTSAGISPSLETEVNLKVVWGKFYSYCHHTSIQISSCLSNVGDQCLDVDQCSVSYHTGQLVLMDIVDVLIILTGFLAHVLVGTNIFIPFVLLIISCLI